MKIDLKIILVILFSPLLVHCQERPTLSFEVSVKDDKGEPVENCEVWAQTFLKWEEGQGFGKDISQEFSSRTNEEGVAKFDFPSAKGDLKFKPLAPKGFYENYVTEHQFQEFSEGSWFVEPKRFEATLKRIKEPVPLYARSMVRSFAKIEIPELGRPCGFDLIESDWVAPHGLGKTSDLVFTLEKDFKSHSDFTCELSIVCSNPKDGFILVEKEPRKGSQLRLPFLAPEEDYQELVVKSISVTPANKVMTSDVSNIANYFLRLRTVLDENKEIESANYAKVHGDFRFDPINSDTAILNFDYYMNPVPNERNLEFDLSRNLLTDERKTDKVVNP